jgi:hypothetical protein
MSLDITLGSPATPLDDGSLGAFLAADLVAAIADYDQTFYWRGFAYPCVISYHSSTLIVAKALFPNSDYPQRGDSIIVASKTRQVVKLNNSALTPTMGGLVEDRPFVDDPSDPGLSIQFGKLISV